ncbi:hypothetical protein CW304_29430 [Bacillus sp. UFRGS-B20]|nr:hypothetical protein CW304_29430 [Bacillus sp. UFRGS-B20]
MLTVSCPTPLTFVFCITWQIVPLFHFIPHLRISAKILFLPQFFMWLFFIAKVQDHTFKDYI